MLTFKVIESDPEWGTLQIKVDAKINAKVGTDTLGGNGWFSRDLYFTCYRIWKWR